MNCSPSFESSTFASAAVQNAKESFIAATSLSFESVSAIFTSGAVCPEIFAQTVLFVCAMCIIRCPNEFISGDGLNTYFSCRAPHWPLEQPAAPPQLPPPSVLPPSQTNSQAFSSLSPLSQDSPESILLSHVSGKVLNRLHGQTRSLLEFESPSPLT